MFGKLVLILATVSQARHLRGPGLQSEFNITNMTASTSEPHTNTSAGGAGAVAVAVAVAGAGAGAGAGKSLVPYYMPKYKFPMCPAQKSKQVAIYKNSTGFRSEL